MRDWYCTVLGAHVVYENNIICFITFDDEHHRMAFATSPDNNLPERPANSTGLMHTAYTFPNLGSLLDHYEMLKSKGILPKVPMQHGITTSLYYLDPDGYFVELQIDNFERANDATAYMHGAEFSANPIGVLFDPEKMLNEFRSGIDEQILKSRDWAMTTPQPSEPMSVFAI